MTSFLRTLQLLPHCLQIKPKLPDIIHEALHRKAHLVLHYPQPHPSLAKPLLLSPRTRLSHSLSIFAYSFLLLGRFFSSQFFTLVLLKYLDINIFLTSSRKPSLSTTPTLAQAKSPTFHTLLKSPLYLSLYNVAVSSIKTRILSYSLLYFWPQQPTVLAISHIHLLNEWKNNGRNPKESVLYERKRPQHVIAESLQFLDPTKKKKHGEAPYLARVPKTRWSIFTLSNITQRYLFVCFLYRVLKFSYLKKIFLFSIYLCSFCYPNLGYQSNLSAESTKTTQSGLSRKGGGFTNHQQYCRTRVGEDNPEQCP